MTFLKRLLDYISCLIFGGCPLCCDTYPDMTEQEVRAALVAEVTAHREQPANALTEADLKAGYEFLKQPNPAIDQYEHERSVMDWIQMHLPGEDEEQGE